jgi:hypothetical protein
MSPRWQGVRVFDGGGLNTVVHFGRGEVLELPIVAERKVMQVALRSKKGAQSMVPVEIAVERAQLEHTPLQHPRAAAIVGIRNIDRQMPEARRVA